MGKDDKNENVNVQKKQKKSRKETASEYMVYDHIDKKMKPGTKYTDVKHGILDKAGAMISRLGSQKKYGESSQSFTEKKPVVFTSTLYKSKAKSTDVNLGKDEPKSTTPRPGKRS